MRLHLGVVGVEGDPCIWTPSTRPHALLTGETGQGKTHLARQLVEQAHACGATVHVADPKGGGDFVRSPVNDLALGPAETVDLLDRAADELARRMNRTLQSGLLVSNEQPLLIVVDELAAVQLRKRGEDSKAARDKKDRVQGALGEIALMGRSARVHLLVLMQRPDTDSIPGIVRDQLGLKVALGWMSPDGYRMVFGASTLEPPRVLRPGHGWVSGFDGHRDGPRPLVVTPQTATPPGRTMFKRKEI